MIYNLFKSIAKSIIFYIIYVFFYSCILLVSSSKIISFYISAFLIIGILVFLYRKELLKEFKSIKKDFNIKLFIIGIITIILPLILINFFTGIPGTQEENINLINEYKVLFPILIIFINPFIEELIFRFSYLNSKNISSFIICILIFTLFHMTSLEDFKYIILYIIPSFGITLNYFKTNNIYISYLLHLLNNLLNVLLLIW